MASIKDIARLAGVSVSTVSRVLTDHPLVGEATRARVQRAIDETQYQPNLLARGLRSRSGTVIGLVVPEILLEAFATLVHFTQLSCAEHGYGLLVGSTGGSPEAEGAFIEDLLRRHVDGIIFSRVSDRSRVIKVMDRSNIPVVIFDRSLKRENIPSVVLDNPLAGSMAAEHLLRLGHRAIGVVTGPQDIALSRDRHRGFVAALSRHGVRLPDSWVFEGDFRLEGGREAAEAFLEEGLPFTALWCHNDLMALGAMRTFARHGIRIPGDLSVMGMDNTSLCEISDPTLSTVTQPFEDMCRRAVELIMGMRSGRRPPERRVVLPPGIIARESSAGPPRASSRSSALGDGP
ncbi:MAG TPA: LacI family DNA-binding transcriptional regulator [Anaeromyxobacter sp.]|nr:LacI family DNA-binding transcriptional regulator [Anaeromyxobacter sp.]